MVRDGVSVCRYKALAADAGYDSEKAHCLLRDELGIRSLIPAKRGRHTHKLPLGRYRRLMATRFPGKKYGQRWQIEATYSQDKRRFGSQIAATTYWSQCRELELRVLVHNIALVLCLNALFALIS